MSFSINYLSCYIVTKRSILSNPILDTFLKSGFDLLSFSVRWSIPDSQLLKKFDLLILSGLEEL
jgi:hypothetical protein